MSVHDFPTVALRIDGRRAFVELNRPAKRNCMSPELHEDMHRVLDAIAAADDVRVLVLTGRGDSFCAGMDLEEFLLGAIDDPQKFMHQTERAFSWIRRLKNFPGVTISAVNGWCVGGGMLVAGLCDISVAATDAKFGLSEINFAVIPGAGLTWVTARHIPRKEAMFYLLTGRLFDGAKAAQLGLVNYAVEREALAAEIDTLSAELASKHRGAAIAIKQVYERTVDLAYDEAVEWEEAKFFQMSYATNQEWLLGLRQFARREFKPGKENYDASRRG